MKWLYINVFCFVAHLAIYKALHDPIALFFSGYALATFLSILIYEVYDHRHDSPRTTRKAR